MNEFKDINIFLTIFILVLIDDMFVVKVRFEITSHQSQHVQRETTLIFLFQGLIKIRGDQCWRDLTCMNYHYEVSVSLVYLKTMQFK